MKLLKQLGFTFLLAFPLLTLNSCQEEEKPVPTKEKMQGVWEVTEAYDDQNNSIMPNINHLAPTYIQMDDKNSVNSSAGPMFMYLVYGKSNFISITSKLDEAFKYADLSLTEGEFFISDEDYEDRFTVEIKMKFPTMETLTTILELMGIEPPKLFDAVIYHKFLDVHVTIPEEDPNTMVWEFDATTYTNYNVKDEKGYYVPWSLIDVPFTKGRFVFTKRVESLVDLVKASTAPKTAK